MEVTTRVSPQELFDLFVQVGDTPPRWLCEELGMVTRVTKADELARLAREAGVPERYVWELPDEGRNPLLAAGTSFYAHGTSGDGKTTVAVRILKGWLAAGMGTARFTTGLDFLSEVGDTYGGGGSEVAAIGRYSGCGLLVLDDLGKEVMRPWQLSKLFQLVDTRYANRRPTVITTQYGLRLLAERMAGDGDGADTAQAIVSRIREAYRGIDCGDEDRRLA